MPKSQTLLLSVFITWHRLFFVIRNFKELDLNLPFLSAMSKNSLATFNDKASGNSHRTCLPFSSPFLRRTRTLFSNSEVLIHVSWKKTHIIAKLLLNQDDLFCYNITYIGLRFRLADFPKRLKVRDAQCQIKATTPPSSESYIIKIWSCSLC